MIAHRLMKKPTVLAMESQVHKKSFLSFDGVVLTGQCPLPPPCHCSNDVQTPNVYQ